MIRRATFIAIPLLDLTSSDTEPYIYRIICTLYLFIVSYR